MESDARSTGVQLKSAEKPSTVVGLITKHADCRILDNSQYVCNALLFFETDKKQSYNNTSLDPLRAKKIFIRKKVIPFLFLNLYTKSP